MSTQTDTLAGASKSDVTLSVVIGIMILVGGIVIATFIFADKTELKVIGTIDVSDYNSVIIMGAGGSLVYLGIVIQQRMTNGTTPPS